jgi:hypothetical protein
MELGTLEGGMSYPLQPSLTTLSHGYLPCRTEWRPQILGNVENSHARRAPIMTALQNHLDYDDGHMVTFGDIPGH